MRFFSGADKLSRLSVLTLLSVLMDVFHLVEQVLNTMKEWWVISITFIQLLNLWAYFARKFIAVS